MLDKQIRYKLPTAKCFCLLRDDILPTLRIPVREGGKRFRLRTYELACRIKEADFESTMIRAMLRATNVKGYPVYYPGAEFRVYCKDDGAGGTFVLVRPLEASPFGPGPVRILAALSDGVGGLLGRTALGRGYLGMMVLGKITVDGNDLDSAALLQRGELSGELASVALNAAAHRIHDELHEVASAT